MKYIRARFRVDMELETETVSWPLLHPYIEVSQVVCGADGVYAGFWGTRARGSAEAQFDAGFSRRFGVEFVRCMQRYIEVDSRKLEHGCRMTYAVFASFFGLGLEDGHVPIFWHPP